MDESKEFLEGKEAALAGKSRFPNSYRKGSHQQYKDWLAGWHAGQKENFDNMPAEEKAKYWEAQWRQSELEKHRAFRHLSKMAKLSEEIWEMKPSMDNLGKKILYENEHGKITLEDCLKAEHFMMHHPPADIEEITEYEEKKWTEILEKNNIENI